MILYACFCAVEKKMILYACFCVCLDRGKFVITILYHDTTFPSPNIMVHDYGFSCNYEQQIMHQNKFHHPSVMLNHLNINNIDYCRRNSSLYVMISLTICSLKLQKFS